MSEASQCGAAIGVYVEGAKGLLWSQFTAQTPARGPHFLLLCNHAMHNGLEVTFVVEGPNAEEAAGRARRLLAKPLTPDQVGDKTRLWNSGRAAERAPKEGYERAELAATLPGCNGLECTVYQYFFAATVRLRERVYVKVVAEGEEFRPSGLHEHFPHAELFAYQMQAGRLAGAGEEAFGKGRPLGVTFVCYSPPGSGAAEEAVSEIRGALEKLREVATWPDGKRSWFAMRRGLGGTAAALSEGVGLAYRPPKGVLSHRPHPPKPAPREAPEKPPSLNAVVRGHLKRWGALEDWDRMRAEGEAKRAKRRRGRGRRAQLTAETEWLERQADPFGRWGGDPWT